MVVLSRSAYTTFSVACLCANAYASLLLDPSLQKRDFDMPILAFSHNITAGNTSTPISDLTITYDKFDTGADFMYANTTWGECYNLGDVVKAGNQTATNSDMVYIVGIKQLYAYVEIEGELDVALDDRISLYRWPSMSTYDTDTEHHFLWWDYDTNFEIDLSFEIALVLSFDAAIKFSTGFDVSVPGGVAIIYNVANGEVLLSQSIIHDATFDFDGFRLDEGTQVTASAALQVRVQAGLSFDDETYVVGADANLVNVTVTAGVSDDCDFYIEGEVDTGIDVYATTIDSDNAFETNPDPDWAETFTVWTTWSTCEIPASTSSSVSATTTSSVTPVPASLLGPHYPSSSSSVTPVPASLLGPHYPSSSSIVASTTSISSVLSSLPGSHSIASTAGTMPVSASSGIGAAYTPSTTTPAIVTASTYILQVSGSAVGTGGSAYRNSSTYTPSPVQPSAYAGGASKSMIAGSAFLLMVISFIAIV